MAAAPILASFPNAGFQPLITPASEENRNTDGLPSILKASPPLNTVPVGAPCGIFTTSGRVVTALLVAVAPEYSVETPVPLSATHAGVLGPNDSPHALTRFGSVVSAWPGVAAARLRLE